jgi:MFS family permease
MISSIFGGMLSDKFRKQKPFVAGSAIVCAIGVWMFAFAPSLTFYYIGNAVLGLGFGAFLAVDIALVARFLPNKEDAAKDFGILNVAGNIPGSIVPVFAPSLIGAGGFTLFYGILGVAALLSAASVTPIPEMPPNTVEEELAAQ